MACRGGGVAGGGRIVDSAITGNFTTGEAARGGGVFGLSGGFTLINTTEGGLLGRGLSSILSINSLLSVQQLLEEATSQQVASN